MGASTSTASLFPFPVRRPQRSGQVTELPNQQLSPIRSTAAYPTLVIYLVCVFRFSVGRSCTCRCSWNYPLGRRHSRSLFGPKLMVALGGRTPTKQHKQNKNVQKRQDKNQKKKKKSNPEERRKENHLIRQLHSPPSRPNSFRRRCWIGQKKFLSQIILLVRNQLRISSKQKGRCEPKRNLGSGHCSPSDP